MRPLDRLISDVWAKRRAGKKVKNILQQGLMFVILGVNLPPSRGLFDSKLNCMQLGCFGSILDGFADNLFLDRIYRFNLGFADNLFFRQDLQV